MPDRSSGYVVHHTCSLEVMACSNDTGVKRSLKKLDSGYGPLLEVLGVKPQKVGLPGLWVYLGLGCIFS